MVKRVKDGRVSSQLSPRYIRWWPNLFPRKIQQVRFFPATVYATIRSPRELRQDCCMKHFFGDLCWSRWRGCAGKLLAQASRVLASLAFSKSKEGQKPLVLMHLPPLFPISTALVSKKARWCGGDVWRGQCFLETGSTRKRLFLFPSTCNLVQTYMT